MKLKRRRTFVVVFALLIVGVAAWLTATLRGADPALVPFRDACRAQFRYLKASLHSIDLAGPPVVTDGYTTNIAEAEWPLMAVAYYGYACANLARDDEEMRDDAIQEMRWAIEALQTPRLSGFMTPHFGTPFGDDQLNPAVFVHGHFLSVAVRYREVTGDTRYDALMQRVAAALAEAYAHDEQGILQSYKKPPMWWITDNFPALSALTRYDRIFHTHHSAGTEKFVASLESYYLDSRTGMFCTYVEPPKHSQSQGPRGISMMYGLQFLNDFAPDFARQQYDLSKKYLFGSIFGCAAVREFPAGQEGVEDIDSGPLVMGYGPSASGFAIAATASMGDPATGVRLLRSLALLGMEVREGDKLHYRDLPDVGQSVILFGRTELLRRARHAPEVK
jgi:hypothetical protein